MRRLTTASTVAVVALAGVGAGLALASGERAADLGIVRVASGFERPVLVTAPRTEPDRLYVVEQPGVIRVLVRGRLRAAPFLDIRSLVESGGNEQGLLGLTFDPAYATNHRFYVNYTAKPDARTVVVAYRSNGARAIPSSAHELLNVAQPYSNHNGGMVAFGGDGKLYAGMGDGGSGGDPENHAQNPGDRLGKLLRLDTLGKQPARIVAIGLRNPWRFSFDRANGDMYIGDVGQNAIEEVDYLRRGTSGLVNFGWPRYEGRSVYRDAQLGPGRLTMPIAQYSHEDGGCTVVGGYVYRGAAVPSAKGRYFYGDFCSGIIWSIPARRGGAGTARQESFKLQSLSSFGVSAAGELYLVSLDGAIYRLRG
jgi:glucose/arabinose dehydrogenase